MEKNLKSNIAVRAKKGYKLYLIRDSKDAQYNNIYKHLRASRNFDVSTSSIFKNQEVDPRISDRIKTHLSSYVYIKTKDYVEEYKVVYKDIYINTPVSKSTHVISSGETLSLIAKNNNTTVQKIADYNGIKDKNNVAIGTELTIVKEEKSKGKIPTIHYEKVLTDKIDNNYVYEKARRSIHIDASYEEVKVYYLNTKLERTGVNAFTSLVNFKDNVTEIGLSKISDNTIFTKEIDYLELPELTDKQLRDNVQNNRVSKDTISVVAIIADELGVVEDLYDYYETSFKTNYSENLPIIKQIKEENAYVYGVSKQINYFYVTKEREKSHNADIEKIKDYYNIFAKEIFDGALTTDLFKTNESELDAIVSDFGMVKKCKDRLVQVHKSFFTNWEPYYIFGRYSQKEGYRSGGFILKNSKIMNNYEECRKDKNNFIQMIIFSVMFSGDYEDVISKNTKLKNAKDDFTILLNNMTPLPAIDNNAIKKIRDRIDTQVTYKDMFNSEDSLLTQHDDLDDIHKQVSMFDSINKTISGDKRYEKLYINNKLKTFKVFEKVDAPITILKYIETYLKTKKIQELLASYVKIEKFEDSIEYVNNYYDMLNIILLVAKNISYTDEEKNITSIFNKDFKYIVVFMLNTYTKILDFDPKLGAWINIQNANKDFFDTNVNMINLLVGHSFPELGNNHNVDKNYKNRKENALKLLNDVLKNNKSKYTIDFENAPNKDTKDHMNKVDNLIIPELFDKEQKIQSNTMAIYEALNTINGVSKRLENIDDAIQNKKAVVSEIIIHNNKIDELKKKINTYNDKIYDTNSDTDRRINNAKDNRGMTAKKLDSYSEKKEIARLKRINHLNTRIDEIDTKVKELEIKKSKYQGTINTSNEFINSQNINKDKFLNSKTYKTTLLSTKVLSNSLAIWSIGIYINSYEKLKTKNLVNLLSDLTTLSGTILANASKFNAQSKILTAISPSLAKYNINLGKFAGGLNIAIVIYTTVSKYMDLDDLDTDAKAITLVSGGLQLGIFICLSFFSGPLVLWGVAVAVFALGEFLMYHFENTQVENYILKSILAKEDSFYSNSDDNYAAKILRQTLANENIEQGEFKTAKEVQKYLGDNHKELKPIFISALKQELSELTRSLHGYKLELYTNPFKDTKDYVYKTGLKVPTQLYKDENFKIVIIDNNGIHKRVMKIDYFTEDNYYVINLLLPSWSLGEIKITNNKSYSIIFFTNNIRIKYNYTYRYLRAGFRGRGSSDTRARVTISDFKSVLLNQKDEIFIKDKIEGLK